MRRGLLGGILAALLVVALLGPLAQILRTQQPFRCFALTFDENFYVHAIHEHAKTGELRANWMSKPFDPILTIGPPIAWGVEATHATLGKRLGLELPQSARAFTSICFVLLLLAFSRRVLLRSRRTIGILFFLFFAVGWIRENPMGGYLVYGVLGEMPAALLTALGFFALRRKRRSWLAGPLLVAAVLAKPSFLPVLPAALLASVSHGPRRAWPAWLSIGVASAAALAWITRSRGESVAEYFAAFGAQTASVSPAGGVAKVFSYFAGHSLLFQAALVFIAFLAGKSVLSRMRRRALDPADRAAIALFGIGILYYFVLGRLPQPKHVFVLFHAGALWASVEAAVFLAKRFGPRVEAFLPEPVLRSAALASVLVWLLHVPSQNLRLFREEPIETCPAKQQRELDRRLSALVAEGVQRTDVAELTSGSASHFLYEIGFSPQAGRAWADLPKPYPRYVAGDLLAMDPLPPECRYEWKASEMALARCGR